MTSTGHVWRVCEVEVWRGGLGGIYLLADSFVCRCLTNSTMLPFPHPAYRTGRADLPHPALGEDSRNRSKAIACDAVCDF